MSSEDRVSESSEDERSTEETDVSTDSGASEDSTAFEPSEGPGGSPPSDREASEWGGYVLALLLLAVFLIGITRLAYPTTSVLVIGALLALFGLAIVVLAVRERMR